MESGGVVARVSIPPCDDEAPDRVLAEAYHLAEENQRMIAEFRGFLTKTNALALAVGVIIGAAVGNVVSALVSDILMPIISLVLPGGGWREAKYVLSSSTDAAGKVVENAVLYGHFIGNVIDFLLISFVVFLIVKTLVKPVPTEAAEPTKSCPECLEMIPAAARRCRACTAAVAVV
jgi:large conductance mechanosensitive channel